MSSAGPIVALGLLMAGIIWFVPPTVGGSDALQVQQSSITPVVPPGTYLVSPLQLASTPLQSRGRLTGHAPTGDSTGVGGRHVHGNGKTTSTSLGGPSQTAMPHNNAPVASPNAPPLVDLIFGVVAFNPRGCSGKSCDRQPYHVGLRRWVRSVRAHTNEAQTELMVLTGRGRGSLTTDSKMATFLRSARVGIEEHDYEDDITRVSHIERSRYRIVCGGSVGSGAGAVSSALSCATLSRPFNGYSV